MPTSEITAEVLDAAGLRARGVVIVTAARDYRNEAASYADAAATDAEIYPDEATGRAAVANGEYFRVGDADGYSLYLRVSSGSSTFINRVSSEWADDVLVAKVKGSLYTLSGITRDASTDLPTAGTIAWLDGSAGAFTAVMNADEGGYDSAEWTHTDSGKTISLTNAWSGGYATPTYTVT
jgi:hypothetical protein